MSLLPGRVALLPPRPLDNHQNTQGQHSLAINTTNISHEKLPPGQSSLPLPYYALFSIYINATMDYSTAFNPLGNSTTFNYGNNTTLGSSTTTTNEETNKSKRFNNWHSRQGISAPQDYPLFANQPAPFSSVPQNPHVPTAASPYIQKIMALQPAEPKNLMDSDEPLEGRRKSTLKKTLSSSPPTSPGGNWPKSMFGSRPPSRTRNRTSSMTDDAPHHSTDTNAPPLISIYDTIHFDPTPSEKPSEAVFTPTQVRISNFSEDRFPDLIRSLRRYYGVILEPYSGLPESESKFHDPEIVPREQLDLKTLRMIQPLAGADGGSGSWVRITFRDREAAERAVMGSERGELVLGGRTIKISFWSEDPINETPLPFSVMQMDIDTPAPVLRKNSNSNQAPPSPRLLRKTPSGFEGEASNNEGGSVYSEHMPGAKVIVPKQVEFAKADGWFSGWTNSLVSAPKAVVGGQDGGGWGIANAYRYVMDDLVGMKRL